MRHNRPARTRGSTGPETPSIRRTKRIGASTNGRELASAADNGFLCVMRRKPRPSSSRDRAARRLVWALGLGLAGVAVGGLLGVAVVDKGFDRAADSDASFAGLSANPDALVTGQADAPPCPDCADSYGVAARLNARHDRPMSDAFRELGQVDGDSLPSPELAPEPADDYRYGGRFPDPAPRPEAQPRPEPRDGPAMVIPVAPPPPAATLPKPDGKPQQKSPGEPPEPPAVPQ